MQLEGLRTLQRTIRAAGLSLEDLKATYAEVADIVVAAGRPLAPVRTGRLVASMRGSGTNSGAVVRAGRAAVPYAGPIHWGWPARHIEAQPWIYDAAVASRDQWTGQVLSALQDLIDQIEGKPGL